MRALWRLASWGTAAALSLIVVVVVARTETGSSRIATAMASPGKDTPTSQISRAPPAAAETKRLADAVRTLTADRDRLATRVGTLERNLEDVTGSIRRQTAAAATPNPAGTTAPDTTTTAAPVREAAVAPTAIPATKPATQPSTTESPPTQAKIEPGTPAAPSGDRAETVKHEFGVDVGGAVSQDGMRALWHSAKGAHAALFEGMHPVVATRENSRTKTKELRLIVGPIDTIEAAHRLCTTLTAARRYCQAVAFEGQKLAEPERKPAQPKSAAPAQQPASRLPWPFR
jgi:hypothetical protein